MRHPRLGVGEGSPAATCPMVEVMHVFIDLLSSSLYLRVSCNGFVTQLVVDVMLVCQQSTTAMPCLARKHCDRSTRLESTLC